MRYHAVPINLAEGCIYFHRSEIHSQALAEGISLLVAGAVRNYTVSQIFTPERSLLCPGAGTATAAYYTKRAEKRSTRMGPLTPLEYQIGDDRRDYTGRYAPRKN